MALVSEAGEGARAAEAVGVEQGTVAGWAGRAAGAAAGEAMVAEADGAAVGARADSAVVSVEKVATAAGGAWAGRARMEVLKAE